MKITKKELKKIIMEELDEIRFGAGGSGGNNPQGIAARTNAGLPKEIYGEAGGGGFKAPTPEDTILGQIIDAIKKLKGERDESDKELSAPEKRAKLKQQIKNKAYADKILRRYKAKKGL